MNRPCDVPLTRGPDALAHSLPMRVRTEGASFETVTATRILLVEDVELEAKLAIRALADRGFGDIVHVTSAAGACEAIDPTRPCVIVTDIELATESGIELVRKVRARGDAYVYILVLTGRSNPVRLREAFEAGADDYMSKPFQREELALRVQVGERIVRLERLAQAKARELETALRKLDASAAAQALARADASEHLRPSDAANALLDVAPWDVLQGSVCQGLAAFLGSPASTTEIVEPSAAIVGEVSLVEATRKVELGLTVVASGPSSRALCMQLLGEPGDVESACALVLETANVLMGSLKTYLVEHGYDFTSGLPSSPSLAEARAVHDRRTIRKRFALVAGDVTVDVWLFLAEKRSSRVKALELREGMVLAEDARDGQGMLLVRAGVRLTETGARRLSTMLGRNEVVIAA